MYTFYEKVCKEKGLRNSDVSKATGVSKQTLSDWKKRNSTPKAETLKRIADYLGVSVDYLLTGEAPTYEHFLDPEVAQMAQEIHDNHNLPVKPLGQLYH